jgi:outer membrane protein assembly factor BamB
MSRVVLSPDFPVHMRSVRALDLVVLPTLALLAATSGCEDPSGPAAGERSEILWRVPAQGAKTTPLILDSLLVFGTLDGSAVAFDRRSGAMRWKRLLWPGKVYGEAIEEAGGLVIVPKYEVWALDPATGAIRWTFAGPDGAAGVHDLATSGDTVYAASAYGWASAVDARTGEAIWNTDLAESPFGPTVAGDLVIYGTRGFLGVDRQGPLGAGHVVALRRRDGTEVWRRPLPDTAGILGGGLNGGAVWEDRLIVGGVAGRVYAFRLSDGEVLWEERVDPRAIAYRMRPVVLDDVAVFARADNAVEARDLATGALRWVRYRPHSGTPPVVVQPWAYVVDGPIELIESDGTVAWQLGGLDVGVGLTFLQARVSAEGIIYTLGQEFTLPGLSGGTLVFAIDPGVGG